MRYTGVLYYLTLALCFLISSEWSVGRAQVDFSQCKSGVEATWAKSLKLAPSLQFTARTEIIDNAKGDRLVTVTETKFKRNATGHSAEGIVTNSPEPGFYPKGHYKSRIQILNTKYSTGLTREHGKTEWLHVGPMMLRDDSLDPKVSIMFSESLARPPACDHLVDFRGVPLAKLFDMPTFQLVKFGVSPAGSDRYRVEYKRGTSATDEDGLSVGWMDLAPAKGWAVVECDGTNTDQNGKSTSHSNYTVEMIEGDVPVLAENTTKSVSGSGKFERKLTQRVKYQTTIDSKIPDSEFTLTYYGFPEPEGIVWKKPIPNYVWILLGAAGLMLLSLLCRWLLQRRAGAKFPASFSVPPSPKAI